MKIKTIKQIEHPAVIAEPAWVEQKEVEQLVCDICKITNRNVWHKCVNCRVDVCSFCCYEDFNKLFCKPCFDSLEEHARASAAGNFKVSKILKFLENNSFKYDYDKYENIITIEHTERHKRPLPNTKILISIDGNLISYYEDITNSNNLHQMLIETLGWNLI